MHKLKELIKRKKKYGYLLITLLLAVFLVATVSARAVEDDQNGTSVLPPELSSSQFGFTEYDSVGGCILFVPTEQGAHLILPVEQTGLVKVTVSLEDGSSYLPAEFSLEYRTEGGEYGEGSTVPTLSPNDNEVFFLVEDAAEVRLTVKGNFTPTEIRFSEVRETRGIEPIPAGLLLVSLGLLILFDRKIGYISFVRSSVGKTVATVREELSQKLPVAILHLLMLLSTAVYAVTLLIFLWWSNFTATAAVVMMALTVVAVLFQILYRCISGNGCGPAAVFLAVALLIGFFFAYTLPSTIGVSWDDQIHYYRTEMISRFVFGHDRTSADYQQALVSYRLQDSLDSRDSTNLTLLLLDQYPDLEAGHFFNFYEYVAYLHLSVIIGLSDLLSIDFLLQMTLMRLSNLFIYVGVLFLGMRKLKKGAYLLSSIALLPVCVFLASTINYDFWLTAFLGYGFCVFLSEMQRPEQPLAKGNLIRMVVSMVVGCGPKAVYFVMLFPLLFISKNKISSPQHKKQIYRWILIGMALIMLTVALPFFFNMDSVTDNRGGADVNSTDQMKFIFSNPLRYAGILLKFIGEYLSLGFFVHSSTFYGYLDATSTIFGSVALAVIAFCTFTDKGECDAFENVGRFKFATLFACFAQIALFSTALYIGFTPVGEETIYGVQWRYLVPVLFPALYCIGSSRVTHRIRESRMSLGVFLLLAFVLLGSFAEVYISGL